LLWSQKAEKRSQAALCALPAVDFFCVAGWGCDVMCLLLGSWGLSERGLQKGKGIMIGWRREPGMVVQMQREGKVDVDLFYLDVQNKTGREAAGPSTDLSTGSVGWRGGLSQHTLNPWSCVCVRSGLRREETEGRK